MLNNLKQSKKTCKMNLRFSNIRQVNHLTMNYAKPSFLVKKMMTLMTCKSDISTNLPLQAVLKIDSSIHF